MTTTPDDLHDLDKQIDDCKSQLKILHAKKKQLKHPHALTMTIGEVAEVLGIGLNQAYEGVKNGQIPAIRIGKRWLVPVAGIEKMLNGK